MRQKSCQTMTGRSRFDTTEPWKQKKKNIFDFISEPQFWIMFEYSILDTDWSQVWSPTWTNLKVQIRVFGHRVRQKDDWSIRDQTVCRQKIFKTYFFHGQHWSEAVALCLTVVLLRKSPKERQAHPISRDTHHMEQAGMFLSHLKAGQLDRKLNGSPSKSDSEYEIVSTCEDNLQHYKATRLNVFQRKSI